MGINFKKVLLAIGEVVLDSARSSAASCSRNKNFTEEQREAFSSAASTIERGENYLRERREKSK